RPAVDVGASTHEFAEWEHPPSGALARWIQRISDLAWQRTALLQNLREALLATQGLTELIGFGHWLDAGALPVDLDITELRNRTRDALSRPTVDAQQRSQLHALRGLIATVRPECAAIDAESAHARAQAEEIAVRDVSSARGGLALGPQSLIVDGVRAEVFDSPGSRSTVTGMLRETFEQYGIPVVTRQVRVDRTGRVLVEALPALVREATAQRQDRLWQLSIPVDERTHPLLAAEVTDEPTTGSYEQPWQRIALATELWTAMPQWGARITDAKRKLARTHTVLRRIFPEKADPDRLSVADEATQKKLLARIQMLTEQLQTIRTLAAAEAAHQWLGQLPGQPIGRWAKLDGTVLTLMSPFADAEHFLPRDTLDALVASGIQVDYRHVQIDGTGMVWSTVLSNSDTTPTTAAPTADPTVREQLDGVVAELDRILLRRSVTDDSIAGVSLGGVLAYRESLVAERERARRTRDLWRAESDRRDVIFGPRLGAPESAARAAQASAQANVLRFDRLFRRLDAQVSRLTMAAFKIADSGPQTDNHQTLTSQMSRSDLITQRRVGRSQTSALLRGIQQALAPFIADPELAEALRDADRHRARNSARAGEPIPGTIPAALPSREQLRAGMAQMRPRGPDDHEGRPHPNETGGPPADGEPARTRVIDISGIAHGDSAKADLVEENITTLLRDWSDDDYVRDIANAVAASIRWGHGIVDVVAKVTADALHIEVTDTTGEHSRTQVIWDLGRTPGPVERAARPPSTEPRSRRAGAQTTGDDRATPLLAESASERPAYQEQIGIKRRALSQRLREEHPWLSDEQIWAVEDMFSELLTNAEAHVYNYAEAHGLNPESVVDVQATGTADDRVVRVTVINDLAPGHAERLPKWVEAEQDSDREGGRGTEVVLKQSDMSVRRLTFSDGKFRIEQSFEIRESAGGVRQQTDAAWSTIDLSEFGLDDLGLGVDGPSAEAGQSDDPTAIQESGDRLAHRLTPRELEVVRMLAQEMTNLEIAAALDISEGTVKSHLKNIHRKLGTSGRADLATVVRENVVPVDSDNAATADPDAMGDPATLSQRELEVFSLVAEGMTNRAVGAALDISEGTVKAHLGNIADKLGIGVRAGIAAVAADSGEPRAREDGPVVSEQTRVQHGREILDHIFGLLGVTLSPGMRMPRPLLLFAQSVNRTVFDEAEARGSMLADDGSIGEALPRLARETLERRLSALSLVNRRVIADAVTLVGNNAEALVPADPDEVVRRNLTKRQAQVLALVAEGKTNAEIGAALGIAASTAMIHLVNIRHKLRVSGRAGLAVTAARAGALPEQDSADIGSPLTDREKEVLALVATGKSNPEIAAALGISVQTVETHLARTTSKLPVSGRAGMAVTAARADILPEQAPIDDQAPLTDREKQILVLVEEELTNTEIGAALGISPRTVQTYLSRAHAKLGVAGRAEMAEAARNAGLLPSANMLSDDEADMLDLAASGKTDKAIAEELGLSEATASDRLTGILHKLGARDRAVLVEAARYRENSTPRTDKETTRYRQRTGLIAACIVALGIAPSAPVRVALAQLTEADLQGCLDQLDTAQRALITEAIEADETLTPAQHDAVKSLSDLVLMARQPGSDDLTNREIEVLSLVAEGMSNVEIGTALELSSATVKVHIARIGEKLGISERAAMAVSAIRAGKIPLAGTSRPLSAKLTERQTEILGMAANGMSNKEISADRHVAELTVKDTLARSSSKLGIGTRAGMSVAALRAGALSSADPAAAPRSVGGRLTARESEILRLRAQGMTIAEVADALRISVTTVGTHLDRMVRKLGLGDRSDLEQAARRVECVIQLVKALWALGHDTTFEPEVGENLWPDVENGIAAQLFPAPLPDATTQQPDADPLAAVVDDIRNKRGGADTAVVVVERGNKSHGYVITNVDGEVVISDSLATPQVRHYDEWDPPYAVVDRAFVAYFKNVKGKLSALDEPIPDDIPRAHPQNPITGPADPEPGRTPADAALRELRAQHGPETFRKVRALLGIPAGAMNRDLEPLVQVARAITGMVFQFAPSQRLTSQGADVAEWLHSAAEDVVGEWFDLNATQRKHITEALGAMQRGEDVNVVQRGALSRLTQAAQRSATPDQTHATGLESTAPSDSGLTNRQYMVLQLIAADMTGPQIAEELGLSPLTVGIYATQIRHVFGARNWSELVFIAACLGILPSTNPGDTSGAVQPELATHEIQLLARIANGDTSNDVAQDLEVSSTTVDARIENIGRKLGVHRRPGMVAVAARTGILELLEPAEAMPGTAEPRLANYEVAVLTRVANGETSKDIAPELNLSSLVVDDYLMRIGRKLRVHNRAAMVAVALRSGLLPDMSPITVEAPGLTSAEIDLLTRVANGDTNLDIAEDLDMSGSAVDKSLARIREKLGTRNRPETVAVAIRSGVISGADRAASNDTHRTDPAESNAAPPTTDVAEQDPGTPPQASPAKPEITDETTHPGGPHPASSLDESSESIPPTPGGLSARQAEILALVEQGMTNSEIATTLGLSVKTVQTHRAEIRRKLQRLTPELERLRTALRSALTNSIKPDLDQLLEQASPEQVDQAILQVGGDHWEALRLHRSGRDTAAIRQAALEAARTLVSVLAAEHNKSISRLYRALATANAAELLDALDQLPPIAQQVVIGLFKDGTPLAAMASMLEDGDESAVTAIVDSAVWQVAEHIATRGGASAIRENAFERGQRRAEEARWATAADHAYSASDLLQTLLPWLAERYPDQSTTTAQLRRGIWLTLPEGVRAGRYGRDLARASLQDLEQRLGTLKQAAPDRYRCVILLHMQGLSVDQTADAMGFDATAIRALAYYAAHTVAGVPAEEVAEFEEDLGGVVFEE
ncbi:LuxR C-terminal-related transcriptional regulator, partial [Nocardia vinacea]|uniref:LuxR C-terminal-related transcriptional regulator n=1 Tax=Nocardia vinacea TaxID=96468 RepID=UPI003570FF2D